MNKSLLTAALLLVALGAGARKFWPNPIVAHRGAWKDAPTTENSIASLRHAAQLRCHGSECDVWFTAEDSLITFHNAKLNGIYVEETPFDQMRAHRLENGEPVPTMREYIAEAMKHPRTKLIIDIKTIQRRPERTIDLALAVNRLVHEMGAQEQVEYLVGYIPAGQALHQVTDIRVAYLGRWNMDIAQCHPDSMMANGFRAADFQDQQYERHPEWIEQLRERGIHLNTWTVDKPDQLTLFLQRGFDYITTDQPALALRLYQQHRKAWRKANRRKH